MQGNAQLLDVAFTIEQANFLRKLTKFQIDTTSLRTGCATTQLVTLKASGYTLCITDAVTTTSTTPSASSASSGTATTTPSSSTTGGKTSSIAADRTTTAAEDGSTSSKLPVLIGSASGGLVLVLVIAVVLVLRHKRRGKTTTEASNTGPPTVSSLENQSNEIGRGGGADGAPEGGLSFWSDRDFLALKVSVGAFADV